MTRFAEFYEPISERGRMLQKEYLDRLAAARVARIPPSTPVYGPDWTGMAEEMRARVRALRDMLTLAKKDPSEGLD